MVGCIMGNGGGVVGLKLTSYELLPEVEAARAYVIMGKGASLIVTRRVRHGTRGAADCLFARSPARLLSYPFAGRFSPLVSETARAAEAVVRHVVYLQTNTCIP